MDFNTFNKGYSAVKEFEHDGLYVSFGTCNTYNDDSQMAIVSIDKPRIYVIGDEVFRIKLKDILHKESSPERKRELCEAEAYKLAARSLKNIETFKSFMSELQKEAYQTGVESARREIRAALGIGEF